MTIAETIRAKLTEAFAPAALDIVDESHLHAGHAGHHPGGESHFAVRLSSAAFAGKSRVEQHRMVHAVLGEELRDRVHALRLDLSTPG